MTLFDVLGADLDAHRHALHLVFGKLPAGCMVGIIQLDAEVLAQSGLQLVCFFEHAVLVLGDRDHDHLDRRDARRQNQAVVVAVHHDQRADHTRGGAPRGLVRIVELVVLAGKGDAKALGKAVSEIVRGAALQSNAVVHHRLDGIGSLRAGELLLFGLLTGHGRDRHGFGIKIGVDLEHTQGLFLCFLGGGVHGVTLLPEKFRGAQERTRGLFPSHHAAPLVVELGQVAVGVDDLFVVLTEQGLGGRTHSQTLGELFLTADRHPRTLRRKALHMILFALQKALGNKHGHIDVFVTGLLEASVHVRLHQLPNRVAVGTDNHAALDARIISQLRLFDNVGVPFCKILVAARDSLDHLFISSHMNASVVVISITFLLYYNF